MKPSLKQYQEENPLTGSRRKALVFTLMLAVSCLLLTTRHYDSFSWTNAKNSVIAVRESLNRNGETGLLMGQNIQPLQLDGRFKSPYSDTPCALLWILMIYTFAKWITIHR